MNNTKAEAEVDPVNIRDDKMQVNLLKSNPQDEYISELNKVMSNFKDELTFVVWFVAFLFLCIVIVATGRRTMASNNSNSPVITGSNNHVHIGQPVFERQPVHLQQEDSIKAKQGKEGACYRDSSRETEDNKKKAEAGKTQSNSVVGTENRTETTAQRKLRERMESQAQLRGNALKLAKEAVEMKGRLRKTKGKIEIEKLIVESSGDDEVDDCEGGKVVSVDIDNEVVEGETEVKSKEDIIKQHSKMLRIGLPEGAVFNSLQKEGISDEEAQGIIKKIKAMKEGMADTEEGEDN